MLDLAEHAMGLLETGLVEVRDGVATFVAVVDGRGGRATADGSDDDALARAARRATLLARQPRAWPVPALPPGGSSIRADVVGATDAPPLPDGLVWNTWVTVDEEVAVATTAGGRAVSRRRFGHGVLAGGVAALVLDAASQAAAVADALALRGGSATDRAPSVPPRDAAEPGTGPVLLGPEAVATVLHAVRGAFGIDLLMDDAAIDEPFCAPGVHVDDVPALRRVDADGTVRQVVELVEDGVLRRGVHDLASAAQSGTESTGHATLALTAAPLADALVLHGATAASPVDLLERAGLYVPALIRNGQRFETRGAACAAGRLPDRPVALDPRAVLRAIVALGGTARAVPIGGGTVTAPHVLVTDGFR